MDTKTSTNITNPYEDKYNVVAEFIMEAALRLGKDVNDIIIGVESHEPTGKGKKICVDIYDTDFNILERYLSDTNY